MADTTAMDLVPREEWDNYASNLYNQRMQNKIVQMQLQDVMKDRKVGQLLTQLPQVQQAQNQYSGRFNPVTGEILPEAVGTAGSAGGAVPISAQQWDEGVANTPHGMQQVPTENQLMSLMETNPELAPQINDRLMAVRKQRDDRIKAEMEVIGKVHTMNPEAANQMFNNNPDLVRMAGGPVKMVGEGNQREYSDSAGSRYISFLVNGKWSKPQPLVRKDGKQGDKGRYLALMTKKNSGQPLTKEEQAFVDAYEKDRTMVAKEYQKRPGLVIQKYYNPETGKSGFMEAGKLAQRTDLVPFGAPEAVEAVGGAKQRTSSQTANVSAAYELYRQNLPEVLDLRRVVANKGMLPSNRLRSLNAVSQWVQMETNDPDMAELQGKVKLMADNLQKTIGGNQGGEWAFKVAADLLDSRLSPEAFERRMRSHEKDLKRLTEARRGFGKGKPKPNTAGLDMDAIMAAARQEKFRREQLKKKGGAE